ncbi:MAG: hypothetical protein CG440_750 [Methanosaeta sp. NSM2]|nr:hypothetical protein [Methanothrix sp.]OYV08963.1 MAG: hypothetical protein CG437_1542 [Methanosaeta sp. NSP1]OYV14227.1 MAG: hypothetical protein CG440_750 [Methanosaeta sp. NSM2]
MKKHIIIILSWACLLLSPVIALAQYDYSTDGTDILRADLIEGKGAEESIDMQGYAEPGLIDYGGRHGFVPLDFYERISNFGDCDWLPQGAICLTFSDKYKWIVHDYWISSIPIPVRSSSCLPIELIRCYNADYYHVLGTSLVAVIKRNTKVFISPPPETCPPRPPPHR